MASLPATPSLLGHSVVAIAAKMTGFPIGVVITMLIVIAVPGLVAVVVQLAAAAVALRVDDEQRAERAMRILEMSQRQNPRARSKEKAKRSR
jgi:choline-glycine betaine transporter